MDCLIRSMTAADLPAILRAQAAVYRPELLESPAFYLNRLALAPGCCQVAELGGEVAGYLVAYPWQTGLPPVLDSTFERLPDNADNWFLHDCAVHPRARGRGLASRLYEAGRLEAKARGLRHASLVSLAEAVGYWLRLGYAPAGQDDPRLTAKLAGYGEGARYMTRALED